MKCWHRWGKWVDFNPGGLFLLQRRTCDKCGQKTERWV